MVHIHVLRWSWAWEWWLSEIQMASGTVFTDDSSSLDASVLVLCSGL